MNVRRHARLLFLSGLVLATMAVSYSEARTVHSGIQLSSESLPAIFALPLERPAGAVVVMRTEPTTALAQATTGESVTRQIEDKGFTKVSGVFRRGENYIFQAEDPSGIRVRGVINARTGEIVGLSRIIPKRK